MELSLASEEPAPRYDASKTSSISMDWESDPRSSGSTDIDNDGEGDPKSLSEDKICSGDNNSEAVEKVGVDPEPFSKRLLSICST
jgi:hypothetical protein